MSVPPIDRSLDIRQMRYFLVLAEELNFRRAAERLHLTQPPLSRQIAALEAALGVRLLERDAQGTRLTPAGRAAKSAFAQAVAAFDAALRKVAAQAESKPARLRLGLPWWIDMTRFAAVEERLRAALGVALIEPVCLESREMHGLLMCGELDAGLMVMPQDLKGLAHHMLAKLPHVALVPAAHPLARKRALRLADLNALPAFFRFARRWSPTLWAHYQRLYDAVGFRPAREQPAQGSATVISQIAAGRGCTVMPQAFARQRQPGVAARRLLDDVHVEVHLVLAEQLPPALAGALRAQTEPLASVLN